MGLAVTQTEPLFLFFRYLLLSLVKKTQQTPI